LTETLPRQSRGGDALGQQRRSWPQRRPVSGALSALTAAASTVTLSGANIPANGSCTITVPVQSATSGSLH